MNRAVFHGVLEVRPNTRLNLIALDTKNMVSMKSLLKVNVLLGISVRAYEPRSPSTPVGVIRRMDLQLSEPDIQSQMRSDVPISHVHRLGSPTFVCVTFISGRLA